MRISHTKTRNIKINLMRISSGRVNQEMKTGIIIQAKENLMKINLIEKIIIATVTGITIQAIETKIKLIQDTIKILFLLI